MANRLAGCYVSRGCLTEDLVDGNVVNNMICRNDHGGEHSDYDEEYFGVAVKFHYFWGRIFFLSVLFSGRLTSFG